MNKKCMRHNISYIIYSYFMFALFLIINFQNHSIPTIVANSIDLMYLKIYYQ
nr:MAG TPA: hypothetical protein [Bacteriophage sp.]